MAKFIPQAVDCTDGGLVPRVCSVCGRFFQSPPAADEFCGAGCRRKRTRRLKMDAKSVSSYSAKKTACVVCGFLFPRERNRRYCGTGCRQSAYRLRYKRTRQSHLYGISSSTMGAIAEMVVATELLKRRFHVFRALSPACPCDLMAISPHGAALRIEVKTGYWFNGKLCYTPASNDCFDLLAVVTEEGTTFIPDEKVG